MIVDIQNNFDNLQPAVLCQLSSLVCLLSSLVCLLSKSAPNILWTARGLLSDDALGVTAGNPTLLAAKIAIRALIERPVRKHAESVA
jgi:hypothetical protein